MLKISILNVIKTTNRVYSDYFLYIRSFATNMLKYHAFKIKR